MLMRASELFTLSDLQKEDRINNIWFTEESSAALAGRCMLDVLEYLRADAKFPGRFWHVTNAHTIRLATRYLTDFVLRRQHLLNRLVRYVDATFRQIREGRNLALPYYGDDFWDWASVLEAFIEIHSRLPASIIDRDTLGDELSAFYDEVTDKLNTGSGDLSTRKEGEWYGPATAAIAHRVLSIYQKRLRQRLSGTVLERLKTLALEDFSLDPIDYKWKYRGFVAAPHLVLWHYGQVVSRFPDETPLQRQAIANLSAVDQSIERTDRAYALARVIQGAHAVGDRDTFKKSLQILYTCENLRRPLGQGLMADNVKGSLNVLEALWPTLTRVDKTKRIRRMIDTLLRLRVAARTIGIVVAVPREANAIDEAFAKVKRKTKRGERTQIIEHENYRVIVHRGKSLPDVQNAADALIDKYSPRCLLMSGIAGSLGVTVKEGRKSRFHGPDKFHVVVAAAHAPCQIRTKARDGIQNTAVPFEDSDWLTIPSHPDLFSLAHKAGEERYGESGRFHEGLVVSGRGILDWRAEKRKVLRTFPGGLAFEEESYMIALLCLNRNVPFLNIRGISDRAEGDKKKQKRNKKIERRQQERAALAAAKLTARVVELLSERL